MKNHLSQHPGTLKVFFSFWRRPSVFRPENLICHRDFNSWISSFKKCSQRLHCFCCGNIRLFFVYSFESFDTWMLRLILTQCKKCWNYKFLCRTRLYLVVERNLIGADFDHVLGNDCASSNQQNTQVPKTHSLFTNRYQKFSRWMVCLRGVLVRGSKLLARVKCTRPRWEDVGFFELSNFLEYKLFKNFMSSVYV